MHLEGRPSVPGQSSAEGVELVLTVYDVVGVLHTVLLPTGSRDVRRDVRDVASPTTETILLTLGSRVRNKIGGSASVAIKVLSQDVGRSSHP
jgi:hypothetical protein